MKTRLKQHEKLVREGKANLQRNVETVGGKLYLTNQRLIFESHKFNIQKGATKINLVDIRSVHLCWTKLLNLIPLFPNGLKVVATTFQKDREYRFTLFGRQKWKNAIEEQIHKMEIERESYLQQQGSPQRVQQSQKQQRPSQEQRWYSPPTESNTDPCPTCGQELRYIEQYETWYCDNCEEYK